MKRRKSEGPKNEEIVKSRDVPQLTTRKERANFRRAHFATNGPQAWGTAHFKCFHYHGVHPVAARNWLAWYNLLKFEWMTRDCRGRVAEDIHPGHLTQRHVCTVLVAAISKRVLPIASYRTKHKCNDSLTRAPWYDPECNNHFQYSIPVSKWDDGSIGMQDEKKRDSLWWNDQSSVQCNRGV